MALIFLKSNDSFEDFSSTIFKTLGIQNYSEGDSQNVLTGFYYSYSIFGFIIKLELNSYDYEEEYKFMMSIKKDFVSNLEIDDSFENMISDIVIQLLKNNLKIEFAQETNNTIIRIK